MRLMLLLSMCVCGLCEHRFIFFLSASCRLDCDYVYTGVSRLAKGFWSCKCTCLDNFRRNACFSCKIYLHEMSSERKDFRATIVIFQISRNRFHSSFACCSFIRLSLKVDLTLLKLQMIIFQ